MAVEQFANNATAQLNGNITTFGNPGASETWTLDNTAAFSSVPQFRILVDSEILLVTAVISGTQLQVTRGYEGTTATTHSSGALVTQILSAGALTQFMADNVPTGTILPFAGVTVPGDYLLCDNSAVSRTTYAALFSALTFTQTGTTNGTTSVTGLSSTTNMYVGMALTGTGILSGTIIANIVSSTAITLSQAATASGTPTLTFYPYGAGDGSTTFNVPDLRGRVPLGPDSGGVHMPANKPVPGASAGGEEKHTLTTAEMPSHSHNVGYTSFNCPSAAGLSPNSVVGGSLAAVTNTGGDGSHNNVQPYLALNFIIRT